MSTRVRHGYGISSGISVLLSSHTPHISYLLGCSPYFTTKHYLSFYIDPLLVLGGFSKNFKIWPWYLRATVLKISVASNFVGVAFSSSIWCKSVRMLRWKKTWQWFLLDWGSVGKKVWVRWWTVYYTNIFVLKDQYAYSLYFFIL